MVERKFDGQPYSRTNISHKKINMLIVNKGTGTRQSVQFYFNHHRPCNSRMKSSHGMFLTLRAHNTNLTKQRRRKNLGKFQEMSTPGQLQPESEYR